MSHSHSHRAPSLAISAGVRRGVTVLLLAVLAAAIYGAWATWPSPEKAPESVPLLAPGARLETGELVSTEPPCPTQPGAERAPDCGTMRVTVDGTEQTVLGPPEVALIDPPPGTRVRLLVIDAAPEPPIYSYFGLDRERPLGLLLVLFVLVTALVAWWRGVLSLVGLTFAGVVVWTYMIPSFLAGASGLLTTMIGCTLIMYVVLYLAHGVSLRTSAALLGTLIGVAVSAMLAQQVVARAVLTGVNEESAQILLAYVPDLEFQGLLTAGFILAGLGILNDVTITQASSVWELRAASRLLSRWEVFVSAMRIGRDHIASTIYTLVFAYAGTSLSLLMLLSLYDVGWHDALTDEAIASEIAAALVASIGLILAVPITTAIAALLAPGGKNGDNGKDSHDVVQ